MKRQVKSIVENLYSPNSYRNLLETSSLSRDINYSSGRPNDKYSPENILNGIVSSTYSGGDNRYLFNRSIFSNHLYKTFTGIY